MEINENIKSKILTFIEKQNEKITQDFSFRNITNILSPYNKFIKDFLSNICFFYLVEYQMNLIIKNKKLIFSRSF